MNRARIRTHRSRETEEESLLGQMLASMKRPDPLEGKNGFERTRALLTRKRSSSSLCKQEEGSLARSSMPSDQEPREGKTTLYSSVRYEIVLSTKGSH